MLLSSVKTCAKVKNCKSPLSRVGKREPKRFPELNGFYNARTFGSVNVSRTYILLPCGLFNNIETRRPVYSESRTNDSFESVQFSESKTVMIQLNLINRLLY